MMRVYWSKLSSLLLLSLTLGMMLVMLQRSVYDFADKDARLQAFTRPLEFNFTSWTIKAVQVKLGQLGLGAALYLPEENQRQVVNEYFELVAHIQAVETQIAEYYTSPEVLDPEDASRPLRQQLDDLRARQRHLTPFVESVLQNQLSATVAELGLTLGGTPVPPVLYHVTPLPLALIVSPRDVIRQEYNISLNGGMTADQRTALEEQVDRALNVSSLVVNIGGMGMYPTMVIQTRDLNWMAEVVAHEWVHNFLTMRPLGLNYSSSPEMRIINETVANLAGKEIRDAFLARFYPERVLPPPPEPPPAPPQREATSDPPAFDFRAEMHITRLRVDELLAEGRVEEAEAYMETRRQFFWENGYPIRKLNQAYFAFHGAYADRPGGAAGAAEDPLGDAVRALRAQSPSLAVFLRRVSWMWSADQLLAATLQAP